MILMDEEVVLEVALRELEENGHLLVTLFERAGGRPALFCLPVARTAC